MTDKTHTDPNTFGRQELDPPVSTTPVTQDAAPPESGRQLRVDDGEIQERIAELIVDVAGQADDYDTKLVRELITAGLKLLPDGRNTGELKLLTAAMKEMRYAYRVFGAYPDPHKVTIFGSARTPEDHPDYYAAVEYGRIMAARGWMAITGAGDGIMKAGHEGPGRDASFGVAIRLPFETTANDVIAGDEKLINFRYFFTRKLMFLSQAEAVVCFPGGFGTMDEAYETLTLIQTGKAAMTPVVLLEGELADGDAGYWQGFMDFVKDDLLARGMISEEDLALIYHAKDPEDAADHVTRFYALYHSSRYVRDELIIRVKRPISDAQLATLNEEFAVLVKAGEITQGGPHEMEKDHLDLPRIRFRHTKRNFGLVRSLIDRINDAAFDGN